jgi:hypothetical protein
MLLRKYRGVLVGTVGCRGTPYTLLRKYRGVLGGTAKLIFLSNLLLNNNKKKL